MISAIRAGKNIGPQTQGGTSKGTIEDFLFNSKICLKSISIRRLLLLSQQKTYAEDIRKRVNR